MEGKIYHEMNEYASKNSLTHSEKMLLKDFCWTIQIRYGQILDKEDE